MLLSTKPPLRAAVLTAVPAVLAVLIWAIASIALPVRSAHADADGLSRSEVSFRGGNGLTLHGTVLAPASPAPGRQPGIVLVGGSGPGPREEYRQEAEAFARAGIVTLVFDKRTVDYSPTHRDFGLLADDALAGVRLLRARAGVDPGQVGLWGFSEGGWVAPLAAARSAEVAYVITIAASGHSPLRTQTWNLTTHLRHRHISGSFLDATEGPAAQLLDSAGLFPEAGHDPLPALEHLRKPPVLALWGEYDKQVPPRESAQLFQQALAKAGNEHVTTRFVPAAAHNGHRTTDGFDRIGGPLHHGKRLGALAPGYADTMTSWIRSVAAGHPPLTSAAPAPSQVSTSVPVPGGAWLQWAALAVLLAVFAGYPVAGVMHRLTARPRRTSPRSARWLAGLGLVTVLGTLLCTVSVFAAGEGMAAPVIGGRPLPWLLLQVLAVAVVATACRTAAAAWRTRQIRTVPLIAAGAVFIPWALWWGLLTP